MIFFANKPFSYLSALSFVSLTLISTRINIPRLNLSLNFNLSLQMVTRHFQLVIVSQLSIWYIGLIELRPWKVKFANFWSSLRLNEIRIECFFNQPLFTFIACLWFSNTIYTIWPLTPLRNEALRSKLIFKLILFFDFHWAPQLMRNFGLLLFRRKWLFSY